MKIDKEKLKLAMANACMSTNSLVDKSGVSRVSIGKFINGKTEPRPVTIGKIARALGVPVTEIIEDAAATANATK